jgi:hypothetical protein
MIDDGGKEELEAFIIVCEGCEEQLKEFLVIGQSTFRESLLAAALSVY